MRNLALWNKFVKRLKSRFQRKSQAQAMAINLGLEHALLATKEYQTLKAEIIVRTVEMQ